MEKFKAVLLSNSTVTTVDGFLEAQKEVNNPMVMILNKETDELLDHYHIVSPDMEDLLLQYKLKFFYTSSVPEGEIIQKYGARFYGVDPDLFLEEEKEFKREKERAAATVRSS